MSLVLMNEPFFPIYDFDAIPTDEELEAEKPKSVVSQGGWPFPVQGKQYTPPPPMPSPDFKKLIDAVNAAPIKKVNGISELTLSLPEARVFESLFKGDIARLAVARAKYAALAGNPRAQEAMEDQIMNAMWKD